MQNQENIKPPKPEQNKAYMMESYKHNEITSSIKKENNIISKAKEVRNYSSQMEREFAFINIETYAKNRLKYLPHVQIKDSRFGNSLVPALPSFLN